MEDHRGKKCFCEDFGPPFNLRFPVNSSFSLCPVACLCPTCVRLDQLLCLFQFPGLTTRSSASEFAAMPPTPQPTDDVDIYFETPADDKEHSRFQRAKEQLEIRHRNRMERVSVQAESGHPFLN